jgi:hypothetical protein
MAYNDYYIQNKAPTGKLNDWQIMVFIDAQGWPRRSIKHRGGQDHLFFARRKMTDEEIEEYKGCYRVAMYRYHDWETLINDEMKYLPVDHPFIQKLIEAMNEFRNIPEKPNRQSRMNFENL